MRNLAGSNDATTMAAGELTLAGIPVVNSPKPDGETHAKVDGELRAGAYLFRFVRGWAYWKVSCSPELPVDLVLQLNATPFEGQGNKYSGGAPVLGSVARAHGYARGMEEEQIREWGPCDSWHIDTPEGLAAFASWCRTSPALNPAPARTPAFRLSDEERAALLLVSQHLVSAINDLLTGEEKVPATESGVQILRSRMESRIQEGMRDGRAPFDTLRPVLS